MKIIGDKKALAAWIWVICFSIIIFLTVPVARYFIEFVSSYLGNTFFIYLVLGVLAFTFICLLYFLIFRLEIRSVSNYIWLIILAGCYVYFILKLKEIPPEAIHFIEYGLLGFFLFRALRFNIQDKSIYLSATLFCLLIGTFDEILQWITPRRFWGFRDVWLNTLSGALFLLAIWKVVKPKIISKKINIKSIRIFSSILASCIIILGICASNTPQRVAVYTKKIPWLSYLQKEEPMSEFGYKYEDIEIGIFSSRLNPEEIRSIDETKSKQNSQILNENREIKYEEFLKEYTSYANPFIHELRVHVFRRDSYFKKAETITKIDEKRESYFTAYKENLILVKYFGNTVKKSIYSWNENIVKEAESLIDKSKHYKSPVSANLFTYFSIRTMWIAVFAFISLLIITNLFFYLREKKYADIHL